MIGSSEMEMEMEMEMGAGSPINFPTLSPLARPIGVSPEVVMRKPGDWYRGNRWPPDDMDRSAISTPDTVLAATGPASTSGAPKVPARQWASNFYAIAVLGEFVGIRIKGLDATSSDSPDKQPLDAAGPLGKGDLTWDRIDLDLSHFLTRPYGGSVKDKVKLELRELAKLIDYRSGLMSEALAQRDGIDTYFRGILSFTAASHPSTFGLMQIALRVGELQAMHYKYKYNRPRPSYLLPWLMPPIEVPGHASYPSGHSTQAHLVALILGEVMPHWVSGADGPLRKLADRIARNREVLGLHYPSDSLAGARLARDSFLLLRKCPTVQGLISRARAEWRADGDRDDDPDVTDDLDVIRANMDGLGVPPPDDQAAETKPAV